VALCVLLHIRKPPCGMYDCEVLVFGGSWQTGTCRAFDIATKFVIIKTCLEMNASKSETRRQCH
jgi:hypothetical protein